MGWQNTSINHGQSIQKIHISSSFQTKTKKEIVYCDNILTKGLPLSKIIPEKKCAVHEGIVSNKNDNMDINLNK